MAELLQRHWDAQFEGMNRRDRRGCSYEAYLADPLGGWPLSLPADLAADVADAEAAIRGLNEAGTSHASLEGLARFLLRAESVASSKIEGLDAGARRLLEAEAAIAEGESGSDRIAVEVLGNIAAMEAAIELATSQPRITLGTIREIHRQLMKGSSQPETAGKIRTVQNWIGGSDYNPCSASFVPPPPEQIDPLLDDLIDYLNSDEHSPVVQAGIAHAQFETIHPFDDGNGRTGRALIHIVLRRRGVAPRFVPPISLVLATWATDYVSGLTTFRHVGAAESPNRSVATHDWLRTFASAAQRACQDAETYAERIDDVVSEWRRRLGGVRAASAGALVLDVLPGAPVVTVESAAMLINRPVVRTGEAINRLVDAGVLRQRNVGKRRNRIFEAPEIIGLFTDLERALASPAGDARSAEPNRPVPARRASE